MVFTKLLFIILILVCLAFYVLYIWDFALILLIVIVSLPVLMFITTYITKRMISVEFAVREKSIQKNKDFPVQLVVTNRSIFPIGKAEAHIEYYNVFSDQVASFDLYLPIQSRNTQRITFQLRSKFCGTIRIKTSSVSLFDPLRIFRFRTGKNIHTDVSITPEGHEISGTVHYTDRVNEESNVFSEHRAGDDPSEVFDLREYNPGDKLNRIHWKLSSKKDEFIVKEYSLPIDVPCAVFLDLFRYSDKDSTLPVFDTLIETLLSLSQFLLDNERGHVVIFFSSAEKCFTEYTVSSSADLANVIREIIKSVSENSDCLPPKRFFIENTPLSYASFTYISSSDDTEITEYIDENVDADHKNAVIVIEDAENAEKTDAGYSSLNVIPVVVGKISSSVKDIDI